MSTPTPAPMRPYRDDDAAPAVALITAIRTADGLSPGPDEGAFRAFVANTANRGGGDFRCVDASGGEAPGAQRALAALLISGWFDDHVTAGGVQVGRVLVHPAHRRRGLGRMLLAEMERHAAANGAGAIQGIAHAGVAASRAFVQRYGFHQVVHDLRLARPAAAPIPDAAPPAGVTLRPYRADEARAWASLVNTCFARDAEPTHLTPEDAAATAALPGCVMRAADAGGQLVGFCWTEPRGRELGVLQGIGVADDHRRCGLARALLCDALRTLVERGHSRVELTTEYDNAPAIALYRSFGFDVVDEIVTWRRSTR